MWTKCVDQKFVCQNPTYSSFDTEANNELKNPLSADEIINNSSFCNRIPVLDEFVLEQDYKVYLKLLKGQSGLYHLWTYFDECDDHQTVTMRCLYVGKGDVQIRITDHIKRKWRKDDELYVTFTPIENRLSKYYEQLFLDNYDFELNSAENRGSDILYSVWSDDIYMQGTHIHELANLSKLDGFED